MLVTNAPDRFPDASRLDAFPAVATLLDNAGARHILLRDSRDEQQVCILPGTDHAAPLAALVPIDGDLPTRVDAVLRLWRDIHRRTAAAPVAPLTPQKRRRMILMVRALDGWQSSATYRDLAAALLDPDVARQSRREWQTSSSRAQIIRIVRDAVRYMEGGYRNLLRPP